MKADLGIILFYSLHSVYQLSFSVLGMIFRELIKISSLQVRTHFR